MNIIITPTKLTGSVYVPSSKSMGHREIICAAMAHGASIVDNVSMSDDIKATCRVMRSFGIAIEEIASERPGRTAFRITGKRRVAIENEFADCGESGSTLRFLIPVGLLGNKAVTYRGQGKLISRPLQAYYDIFDRQGITYEKLSHNELPLRVEGMLNSGAYEVAGNVSSQFVSGLLFALPLVSGDSQLTVTSPLESASYVDLTVSCLKKHGIIINHDGHQFYTIPGNQNYQNGDFSVEGDYSQAAFWLVAGTIGGAVTCLDLDRRSLQGDKAILSVLERMGATVTVYDEGVVAEPATTQGIVIDGSDCPDIIPVLTVLAAVSQGTTQIINAGRLRIKECDRLQAITQELSALGAQIEELPNGLIVHGREMLDGGIVEGHNDHRIAMALAIASLRCKEKVYLHGAECVAKSYPDFWQDFRKLGGQIEVEVGEL